MDVRGAIIFVTFVITWGGSMTAFFLRYWVTSQSVHVGLWQTCYPKRCKLNIGDNADTMMLACQVLMSLCQVGQATAFFSDIKWRCSSVSSDMSYPRHPVGFFTTLAGLLGASGIFVFIQKHSDFRRRSLSYGSAFILCCVTSSILIILGFLICFRKPARSRRMFDTFGPPCGLRNTPRSSTDQLTDQVSIKSRTNSELSTTTRLTSRGSIDRLSESPRGKKKKPNRTPGRERAQGARRTPRSSSEQLNDTPRTTRSNRGSREATPVRRDKTRPPPTPKSSTPQSVMRRVKPRGLDRVQTTEADRRKRYSLPISQSTEDSDVPLDPPAWHQPDMQHAGPAHRSFDCLNEPHYMNTALMEPYYVNAAVLPPPRPPGPHTCDCAKQNTATSQL